MQQRMSNIENLMGLYGDFAEAMSASQQRLDASQERMSQNQRQIAENQVHIAENLRRIDENLQLIDENHRLLVDSHSRIDQLLQQMLQAVAVMQAEIVRIDETHN